MVFRSVKELAFEVRIGTGACTAGTGTTECEGGVIISSVLGIGRKWVAVVSYDLLELVG